MAGRKFAALEVEDEGGGRGRGTVLANVAEDYEGGGRKSEKKKKGVAVQPLQGWRQRVRGCTGKGEGVGVETMQPFLPPPPPSFSEREKKEYEKNKEREKGLKIFWSVY